MARSLASSLLLTLSFACGSQGSELDGATVFGSYRISSEFDLTRSERLPGRIDEATRSIALLAEDPAAAMIDGLARAPRKATALAFVPGAVRPYLEDWINDYVFARLYDGVPATRRLADLAARTRTMLATFELVTTLRLDLEGAVHTLEGVAWRHDGERLYQPACVGQTIASPLAYDLVDADLALADHHLAVPLGTLMVEAVNRSIDGDLGGRALASALERAIGCEELAIEVATRCAEGVCLEHEDDLRAFCQEALSAVADHVVDDLGTVRIDALQLRAGAGTLHASGARVDRIDGGVWYAALDLGEGPVPVRAPFEGWRDASEL